MKTILLPAALCVLMLLVFSCVMDSAMADVTSNGTTTNDQVNSSGSNTAITGGYSSTASTTYSTGSSSNSTTTNTTNAYQGDSRVVPSASAPAISSMSQDVCAVAVVGGVQKFGLGVSMGTSKRDMNCERLKLAKLLFDFNMKVSSISLLCQDMRVFSAMAHAGTPCPFNGKIGDAALAEWQKYDKLIPDYEQYTADLKYMEKVDEEEFDEVSKEAKCSFNCNSNTSKLGNE
jgi:hypothetical protein